jgi:hypothetical protein
MGNAYIFALDKTAVQKSAKLMSRIASMII